MADGVARNLQRLFRAYRRWVDRDLIDPGTRGVSALMPFWAGVVPAILLGVRLEDTLILAPLGAVLAVRQGWRFTRVFHAVQVADWVAGKRYEREGRYKLPPEYRDTEHASLAARRRRRENG